MNFKEFNDDEHHKIKNAIEKYLIKEKFNYEPEKYQCKYNRTYIKVNWNILSEI